jgi:pyridinium-3,5-bisthiocarboxylic acid mononucleotide nickel chelatase
MRVAYIECFSGISGDMLLGALLHAGVGEDLLRRSVAALNLDAELRIRRVDRSGISATKVDVLVNGKPAERPDASHKHGLEKSHAHSHIVEDQPPHSHLRSDDSHGRTLSGIREIIRRADIPAAARDTAIRAFELLGETEAGIHNVPVESIHFHEVGAEDAIIDIVCAAIGCHALSVDRFICSLLNVGSGTVQCAHGEFPVPAPATLSLLRGAPVYSSGINAELVTPTGAALLRALNCCFATFPAMKVQSVGYGAGLRDLHGSPNVLRISVGELIETSQTARRDRPQEEVTILETAIDDLSPQVMGYVTERLLAAGALDVFVIPAQMKKNRPGSLLTVICEENTATTMREILFRETSTIGIRTRREERDCLERAMIPVSTQWGMIRVKESRLNRTVTNYAPEYEDCRRIAETSSVPLKQVQQETISSYLAQRHPFVSVSGGNPKPLSTKSDVA